MNTRLDYFAAAPTSMATLIEQEENLAKQFSADKVLLELVKLRVSQINQCAFCVDLHVKELLKLETSFEKITGLSVWNGMPCYTELEREALHWAELTTIGKVVLDADYERALRTFGEEKLVNLTVAINAINSWNRIAKSFKPQVGSLKI